MAISAYFFFKFRALISTKAQVQFTNRIEFGRGTVVKSFAVIQTQTGRIVFGENCAVSSFDHISTGTKDIIVGNDVRIAPNVTLIGGSRNFALRSERIVEQGSSNDGLEVGDDVLIGANVVVLPGCHLGKGAVIGAGSVVTKPVPPYAIVAGSPAKVVGERKG